MSSSSAATWLRRVCLDDYGYTFGLPALAVSSAAVSHLVITHVDFTEIDFQTYLAQAALFLNGERNYTQLDPLGGSGPCVYPALHLYIYSFFHWLTNSGTNLARAQYTFALVFTANNLVLALIYRHARMPPITLVSLILSKRIVSIFLLRMFNDALAMLFAHVSLLAMLHSKWKVSAILLSLGVAIKMNVLLFVPGMVTAVFMYTGVVGTFVYVAIVGVVQVVVAWPFTWRYAREYWTSAFDFSRRFGYEWTVNWRFVPEWVFVSKLFANGLLAVHLGLLAALGVFVWTPMRRVGPKWLVETISRPTKPRSDELATPQKLHILWCAFGSNFVGVICSRSLHYQFYSWYFGELALLVGLAGWSTCMVVVGWVVVAVVEVCWNVFPSTCASTMVLLVCHAVGLVACFRLPVVVATMSNHDIYTSTKPPKPRRRLLLLLQQQQQQQQHCHQHTLQRRLQIRDSIVTHLSHLIPRVVHLLPALTLLLTLLLPYPHSPLSKATYVDENALQPTQARTYWNYNDVTHTDKLREKLTQLTNATIQQRTEFLLSEFESYGLEAHKQTYNYTQSNQKHASGENVYARAQMARMDGREVVIVTASWKSGWKGENDDAFVVSPNTNTLNEKVGMDERGRVNVGGIGVLLGLARYVSTFTYGSKDVVFVVSDGYVEGIHAWSCAYFGENPTAAAEKGGLVMDELKGVGGVVWNAISVDYACDSFSSIQIAYQGIFGQLPNMDMINTLERIAHHFKVRISFLTPPTPRILKPILSLVKPHISRLTRLARLTRLPMELEPKLTLYQTGLQNIYSQLLHSLPNSHATGPHVVFQPHHIDALTLYAKDCKGPHGIFQLGNLIESLLHSISNLGERLHHSHFLYLMVTPTTFIPINHIVLIPFCAILYTLTKAITIYLKLSRHSKKSSLLLNLLFTLTHLSISLLLCLLTVVNPPLSLLVTFVTLLLPPLLLLLLLPFFLFFFLFYHQSFPFTQI